MLEISSLSKSFGPKKVITSLDHKIEGRGIYSIEGANGIGKSTLIRMIAGAEAPSQGQVKLDGLEVTQDPIAYRRLVSWMPEVDGVFPFLTPEEYFRFVLRVRSLDSDLFPKELIHELGLREYTGTRYSELSLGNKKKTLFIAALMVPCKALLLDESSSGFDARSQKIFLNRVSDAGKNALVLLVNHDAHALEELNYMRLGLVQEENKTLLRSIEL